MPASVTLSTEEKVLVTAQPITAAGNPAIVDGAAAFSVQSGTCTIEEVDALSAYIVSGDPGDSTIQVACDADLGSGVVPVSDVVTAHVTSATAASINVSVGAPVLK